MNKREELIQKYALHMREALKHEPDMELLTKVTIACGPSIYNTDASMVSMHDQSELETVKKNFMVKKLGMEDSDATMEVLKEVIKHYNDHAKNKYRAVLYYMITKHVGKESVFA